MQESFDGGCRSKAVSVSCSQQLAFIFGSEIFAMTLLFLHVLVSKETRMGSRKKTQRIYGIKRLCWMIRGNIVSWARLSGGHLPHTIRKRTRSYTRYTVNLHAYKHPPSQIFSQYSMLPSIDHSTTCQHALLHSNLPTTSKTVVFIQSPSCLALLASLRLDSSCWLFL